MVFRYRIYGEGHNPAIYSIECYVLKIQYNNGQRYFPWRNYCKIYLKTALARISSCSSRDISSAAEMIDVIQKYQCVDDIVKKFIRYEEQDRYNHMSKYNKKLQQQDELEEIIITNGWNVIKVDVDNQEESEVQECQ